MTFNTMRLCIKPLTLKIRSMLSQMKKLNSTSKVCKENNEEMVCLNKNITVVSIITISLKKSIYFSQSIHKMKARQLFPLLMMTLEMVRLIFWLLFKNCTRGVFWYFLWVWFYSLFYGGGLVAFCIFIFSWKTKSTPNRNKTSSQC